MCIATQAPTTHHGRPSWEARRAEAQAFYGPAMPWWAYSTAEERRAAIEAKLDREQPLPTYLHGRR